MSTMFTNDFKKTSSALQLLSDHLDQEEVEIDPILNSLDMILKWLALQLLSTNTTVQSKTVDCIFILFDLLRFSFSFKKELFVNLTVFNCCVLCTCREAEYQLTEFEAGIFFTFLANKLGNGKDNIRSRMREVVTLSTHVCPSDELFQFLVGGMASKVCTINYFLHHIFLVFRIIFVFCFFLATTECKESC